MHLWQVTIIHLYTHAAFINYIYKYEFTWSIYLLCVSIWLATHDLLFSTLGKCQCYLPELEVSISTFEFFSQGLDKK